MSDSKPERLKPRPRRAAPLQPDRPGSGAGLEKTLEKSPEELEQAAADKRREQAETAHENTRNGFG